MELIEQIDSAGNAIAVRPKDDLKTGMFLHKVSLIIPRGKDGTFILAKRAADKHPFPGSWCCGIGGKVASGETYLAAAERECEEEVGMSLALQEIVRFLYDEDDYKALFVVYTTRLPIALTDLKPHPGEIEVMREFSREEMCAVAEGNETNPTFREAVRAFVAHLN